MRYRSGHKAQTRRRIVEHAAALFRRHGYRGVGIDRIMQAAELTRGGFYAHFESKAALFAAVLGQESDFARRLAAAPSAREVIARYLDPAHRERVAGGCNLASLTNDVPRADPAARRAFAAQLEALVAELAAHVPPEAPDRRARALEAVALCVGGIGLARGIDDSGIARELLVVCRDRASAAISGEKRD